MMEAQDCLQILRDIKDVAFATVDEKGMPRTQPADAAKPVDANFYCHSK